ncbi:MAG TPA: AAA family ATPase [Candidatus Acidoferrum sp.]|nr:AAA family ATPase [Candidatus Acidoferrum sp.]
MPAVPLTDSKSIKMLLNAPSGWGKTRLFGTAQKSALFIRPPVDYVDSILPEDKPRHKQWVVRDWSAMEDVYEHCRHEGQELYDWVFFDSISSYQDIGLDDLWETIIIEKPARKRYGLDKGDYWINMQRLGRWVRDMATLSDSGAFNLGITAWPAELSPSPEDEEIDRKMMPWVQGKNMAMKVCGYMNIVAFGTVTSKGTRRLQLNETEHIYAKDQFDCTDKGFMLNPTIPKLVSAIDSKRGSLNGRPRTTGRKRAKVKGAR